MFEGFRSLHRIGRQLGAAGAVIMITSLPAATSLAQAQTPVAFAYSSTEAGNCKTISTSKEGDGATRVCGGIAGLSVLINESDLRETVSVGVSRAAAAKEPAASAWFGPFNSSGPKIEWRMTNGKPFAIIQRWQIADNDAPDKRGGPTDRSMLIVTRLPPGPVCHVAYVDAKANPNANELARQAADDLARGFNCGKDTVRIVGQRGRAVDLATAR